MQGVAAFPILATAPALASEKRSVEEMLSKGLAGIQLPFEPAHLELVNLSHSIDGALHHVKAVVCLSWPPGMRRRPFGAMGPNSEHVVHDLLDQIAGYFSRGAPSIVQPRV